MSISPFGSGFCGYIIYGNRNQLIKENSVITPITHSKVTNIVYLGC